MAEEFRCERCEKAFIEHIVKTSGNKNVYIDTSRMTSRCKIPRFTHNDLGMEVVIYYDCVNQRDVIYTQKVWLEKRARGEL